MARQRRAVGAIINARVSVALSNSLDAYAEGEGISFSEAIRDLLTAGLLAKGWNPRALEPADEDDVDAF